MKKGFSIIISVLFSSIIFAQTKTADFSDLYYEIVVGALLLILAIIAAAFMIFGSEEKDDAATSIKESKLSIFFSRVKNAITASTPIEKENEILLEDDYDGIKELDNRVPPWFSYLFYATIVFAFWYLIAFHVVGTGKLQEQEYAEEMEAARIQREELVKSGTFITAESVSIVDDPAVIDNGKQIYSVNCVACHGSDGGGIVGPNLTDDYWINGGSIKDIFRTISDGVPAKGMISWKAQLNPKQIQDLSNFIIKLHGSKPANPKAPQGEKLAQDSSKSI